MLEKFDVPDHIPLGFSSFYGWVAWHFEPFQVCADKTRRAFEIALSSGHVDIAFDCSFNVVKYAIFSGENLRSLLKEIDYYLHLLGTYKSEVARNFLLTFRETVSLLIDNGQATSIGAKAYYGDLDDLGNKMRESFFFHKAIQCYWLGHTERCRYYSEKCMTILGPLEQFNTYMSKFYHGKEADATLETDTKAYLTSNLYFFSLVSSLLRIEFTWYHYEEKFQKEERRCASCSCLNSNEVSSCQFGLELH